MTHRNWYAFEHRGDPKLYARVGVVHIFPNRQSRDAFVNAGPRARDTNGRHVLSGHIAAYWRVAGRPMIDHRQEELV